MRTASAVVLALLAACSEPDPSGVDAGSVGVDAGSVPEDAGTVQMDAGAADSGARPDVGAPPSQLRLTILHNNDGESQLLNAGTGLEDFGGIARFVAVKRRLAAEGTGPTVNDTAHAVLTVSSGDNVLPGAELQASITRGPPFFDSLAIQHIGYDALALGNHDFDLGPQVLADLIEGVAGSSKFVSANLDFSMEPRLQALVGTRLVTRAVIEVSPGVRIGVVGLTTPSIVSVSSPRNVVVDADVTGALNREVAALELEGINRIILLSHLQDLANELALIATIRGVDVVVAGGGDELLAAPADVLVPGDGPPVAAYPLLAADVDGASVPVVTTPGAYKYVGRLIVDFDGQGRVTSTAPTSGLVRVAGGAEPDAVTPDPDVQTAVEVPLQAALSAIANNAIATTQVPLDGLRASVRSRETNLGNLVADALVFEAARLAPGFALPAPTVGLMNGGGIRNDSILPAGPITELDTMDILPFPNTLVIVPDVAPSALLAILEHAAGEVGGGAFLHVSGLSVAIDVNLMPRVKSVTLSDGTALVTGGQVVAGAPNVHVATISFLSDGGGGAPFGGLTATSVGATEQQALARFVADAAGLNGLITTARYPEGGEGRIQVN